MFGEVNILELDNFRRRTVVLFGIVCLVSASGCVWFNVENSQNVSSQTGETDNSADETTIVLNRSDHGGVHPIRVGNLLQIELEGNPTTGFEWDVDAYDHTILNEIGEKQYRSHSQPDPDYPVVGQGGTYTFQFKAITSGQCSLKLVYRRVWEDLPPHEVFEVTVITE